jgi:ketosteroid isomerase-like protein
MASSLFLRTACLTLSLLLASAGVGAYAQAKAKHRVPRHEYKHEVEDAEEQWRTAMLGSNSDSLGKLLAEDYTGITSSGAIQTRDQAISSLRGGSFRLTALTVSDRKVRIYGGTAVVTSQAELTGSRDAQSISGKYRYTRVYVRNGQGLWKIVSFEASRILENGEHR